jgi:hypothetical protein
MKQCFHLLSQIFSSNLETLQEISKQKLKRDQTSEFKLHQAMWQEYSYLSLNFEESKKKKLMIKHYLDLQEEVKQLLNAEKSLTSF